MTNEQMCKELKDLIQLDIDAIRAYQHAIDNIKDYSIKSRLTEFQQDHRRHVTDLSPIVTRYGDQPPRDRPDVKGFLIEGMTALRSNMGTEQALKAMQSNERLTNKNYGQAVSMPWPQDVETVIQRCAADERRHLEYIDQCLQTRPWESSGAHA
ncbi:hypothetical protein AMPC_17780 [Anaeromyxobacter paludicola]|uniref:DUF2383 domain-containing protein n=2 Tax=Anaeromyxobacter paludicola TaxID=2918171 RepID=A0ABN6N7Z9_9BACT|nr:hypothetical protein AMPC_17780 [Anaeromyxobacter paludicola]